MIRVLLVDDEPDVRDTIRSILATDGSLETAVACDGAQAVEHVDRHRPDIVLLDIRMPGGDGLTAAQEIRRRHPSQRIVVLTTFGEAEYVARAVALGVNGFLLKAGDPHELLAGLHAVADGGACLSPTVAAMVLSGARGSDAQRATAEAARTAIAALPPRERDVVDLVARGLANAQIAQELHLAEATVKSYLTTAFARLGVGNRVQAALLVWRAR